MVVGSGRRGAAESASVSVPTRIGPRGGVMKSTPVPAGTDARKQRERAAALIKKHGGRHGHEGARTDWVVSLVMSIDRAYWKTGDARALGSRRSRSAEAEAVSEQLDAAVSEIKALREELETVRAERAAVAEEQRNAESHAAELRHRLATAESLSATAVAEMESLRERLGKDRLRDLKLRGKNGARVHELKERLEGARNEIRTHRGRIRSRELELETAALEQQQHLARRAALERQLEKLSSTRERDRLIYDSELTNLKIQLANATVSRAPVLRTQQRARAAGYSTKS